MIILWISIWFISGFLTVLAIHNFKEKRKIEKEMAEQMMLHYALSEKTPTEISALCTTFGINQAYEIILNDYKIRHGCTTKD